MPAPEKVVLEKYGCPPVTPSLFFVPVTGELFSQICRFPRLTLVTSAARHSPIEQNMITGSD